MQLPLGLALLGILVVLDLLDGRLHLRVVLQSTARVQKELVDAPERLFGRNFIPIYEIEGNFDELLVECIFYSDLNYYWS